MSNCLLHDALSKIDYGHTRHCEDCREVCVCQWTTQRAFWKIWVGVCVWLSGRWRFKTLRCLCLRHASVGYTVIDYYPLLLCLVPVCTVSEYGTHWALMWTHLFQVPTRGIQAPSSPCTRSLRWAQDPCVLTVFISSRAIPLFSGLPAKLKF